VERLNVELLKRLCDAPGVSGCEEAVGEIIAREAGSYANSVHTDSIGNLYMSKGHDKPGPHVMFAAHTDEVGLMVDRIDDEGFIKFIAVGGVDSRVLPAKRVRLGKEGIPGVIGVKPIHLGNAKDDNKIIPISDLRIDIGAASKAEAEKFVEPGTAICFDTVLERQGEILKAKAFDDRAGCYMMAELIKHDFDIPVTFAWTVQEEVGLRGGRIATARVNPDVIIVLEGTAAGDVPPKKDVARRPYLGKGPVITILDWSVVAHQKLVELLTHTGDREGIPWQYKRPLIGGTDAGAAIRVKALAAAVIAIPARYIHSPVALAHAQDIINAIELVKVAVGRLREVKFE